MVMAKQTEMPTVKLCRNKVYKTRKLNKKKILKTEKVVTFPDTSAFLAPKIHQDSRFGQIREKRINFYFFKRYSNLSVMSNTRRVYFLFSLSMFLFTALYQ